jgi:hypothetical protein
MGSVRVIGLSGLQHCERSVERIAKISGGLGVTPQTSRNLKFRFCAPVRCGHQGSRNQFDLYRSRHKAEYRAVSK